jgi:hypothetical protein
MKKQTAVEWYYEQTIVEGKTNYAELLEQAKEMEKEQTIHSYKHGQNNGFMYSDGNGLKIEAEQYYNETYNA